MTLSEKVDVKNRLIRIYIILNDIKRKEHKELLDKDLIENMNAFHESLGEFLG